jgi:hypothetical protein
VQQSIPWQVRPPAQEGWVEFHPPAPLEPVEGAPPAPLVLLLDATTDPVLELEPCAVLAVLELVAPPDPALVLELCTALAVLELVAPPDPALALELVAPPDPALELVVPLLDAPPAPELRLGGSGPKQLAAHNAPIHPQRGILGVRTLPCGEIFTWERRTRPCRACQFAWSPRRRGALDKPGG